MYWLKKVELSGKRVVRNGVSFSNSWEKNKLHCGNTVCEPDERFSLLTGPYPILEPTHPPKRAEWFWHVAGYIFSDRWCVSLNVFRWLVLSLRLVCRWSGTIIQQFAELWPLIMVCRQAVVKIVWDQLPELRVECVIFSGDRGVTASVIKRG